MKKIDHFRSWSPETKMVVIFGILDPENPRNQPKTKFSPKLKIDPETLNISAILVPAFNLFEKKVPSMSKVVNIYIVSHFLFFSV